VFCGLKWHLWVSQIAALGGGGVGSVTLMGAGNRGEMWELFAMER